MACFTGNHILAMRMVFLHLGVGLSHSLRCRAARWTVSEALAGSTDGFERVHAKLNSGHDIPLLGWGSFQASADEAEVAVQEALHAGFRVCAVCCSKSACVDQANFANKPFACLQHIDTATAYGNEQGIGKGLQEQFRKGSVRREDLFITSKLWNSDHAASAVHSALNASLAKLKLDYLDLYLIHWCVT